MANIVHYLVESVQSVMRGVSMLNEHGRLEKAASTRGCFSGIIFETSEGIFALWLFTRGRWKQYKVTIFSSSSFWFVEVCHQTEKE